MAKRADLDEKSRAELLVEAEALGVERPSRMTRVELRDEIIRKTVAVDEQAEARGLFGVARSMLASVVESGLNMPDAAKRIRGEGTSDIPPGSHTPVATVTLAEIYAAQGHRTRALRVLEDVLLEEPDHEEARRVRAELLGETGPSPSAAPGSPRADVLRDDETRKAPQVSIITGETMDYVPGGFVETTGEEIETGKPPVVVELEPEPVAEVEPLAESVPSATLEADDKTAYAPVPEPAAPAESTQLPESALPEIATAEAAATASSREPALVLTQDLRGLSLYWEVPDESLAHAQGRVVVRVVSFTPKGASPERLDEVVEVRGSTGVARLSEIHESTAVRAALGVETDHGFLPLTVGRSLEEWGADGNFSQLVRRAVAAD